MESEFITLDKAGEEVEWLRHFLEDMLMWMKLVPFICILVIANQRLVGHRVICITVSLDIFVE